MKYQIAEYSVRGARELNQDAVGYAERANSVLLVLADGLGGHAGSELASKLLVDAVIHAYHSIRQPLITQPSTFLALAIMHAHRAINAMGKTQNPPIEPRTTCVLCLVQDGYAYWAHVGDSRLYLVRNSKIVRRTKDHTLIEQMRQEGVLTDTEMQTHPEKSRLLRCVGGPRDPLVTLGEETSMMPGDVLLLCSDGLWEALSNEEMCAYLSRGNLEDAVVDMLMAAESKMDTNSDNISATCLRWDDAMTDKPPLQAHTAGEVNYDSLRSIAARKHANGTSEATPESNTATGSTPESPGTEGDNPTTSSLENEIEKLESFLEDFLPKR